MTADDFRGSCSLVFPFCVMPSTLRVGARLNVAANQLPGVYSGTFDVTAHNP